MTLTVAEEKKATCDTLTVSTGFTTRVTGALVVASASRAVTTPPVVGVNGTLKLPPASVLAVPTSVPFRDTVTVWSAANGSMPPWTVTAWP